MQSLAGSHKVLVDGVDALFCFIRSLNDPTSWYTKDSNPTIPMAKLLSLQSGCYWTDKGKNGEISFKPLS